MSEAATSPIEVVLRGPRWMRIALVASLALNLATFGVIIASIWQWRHLAHGMPFGFPAQLLEFSRTLPANRESELKGMVASSEPQIEPLREEARQARREAVRTFVSDPFDKDSFVAANGRLIEQELKVRQAQLGIIADVAAKMPPEERRAFVKWRRANRPDSGRKPGAGAGSPASEAAPQAKQP